MKKREQIVDHNNTLLLYTYSTTNTTIINLIKRGKNLAFILHNAIVVIVHHVNVTSQKIIIKKK